MCATPQLVSAPLNPIPIAEHFRRKHPLCEHSYSKYKLAMKQRKIIVVLSTRKLNKQSKGKLGAHTSDKMNGMEAT